MIRFSLGFLAGILSGFALAVVCLFGAVSMLKVEIYEAIRMHESEVARPVPQQLMVDGGVNCHG